jgi:hypothetical protein
MADGEQEDKISRRELLSQQMDAEHEEAEHGVEPSLNNHPDSYERSRDESGKFVSRETAPAKVEKAPAEQVAAPETPQGPPVWERPPKSWKKDYHEIWPGIDERARQYVHQRENELLSRYSELGQKAKIADAINQVAEPYMNTIRGMGIDLPRAVKGLMEADNALRTLPPDQRMAYFVNLGQQYGINLNGFAPQQGQVPQSTDPNYHALLNQFNNLRGEVVSFKQSQEAAQEAEALAQVNSFASTHEYFEELRPTITRLIETGLETTLEGAYTHALKVDDELSAQIATAQQASQQASQRDTANRAAKAAKAAAVSVRGSSPGARPASKAQSRREMLAEQLESIDSRF